MVYKAPDDEIGAPTCIAGSSAQCGKQGSAPAVLLALVATGLLAAVAATATAAAATAAAVSKAAAVAAPDPYHIFPRQFIDAPVSTGELRNASCVTVFGHTDGFGAQFSSLMSGVLFAHLNKIPFRHFPLRKMAHWNPPSDGPLSSLEDFMGLQASSEEAALSCLDRQHFVVKPYERVAATKIEMMSLLRTLYFSSSKSLYEPTAFGSKYAGSAVPGGPLPSCTPESCDIVVHIRRGDISGNDKHVGLHTNYITDAEWLHALDQVKSDITAAPLNDSVAPRAYSQESKVIPFVFGEPTVDGGASVEAMKATALRFHVLSEGRLEDLQAFQDWANETSGVAMRFHLNGDLRAAFHMMVVADVMVYGPSSFPALAADYNPGKHYQLDKFVHSMSAVDPITLPVPTTEMIASILSENQPVGAASRSLPGKSMYQSLKEVVHRWTSRWF